MQSLKRWFADSRYPGYRYQPVYRRTNVVRRRVRKDAAEEEKCKSVAQLLMQGKTGEELAEEIKENGTKSAGKHARYVLPPLSDHS
jgi:HMG box factor